MSDNGNRLHQFLDVKLDLTRDAVTVAWLAMQAKGKQKGKDLQAAARIREAILEDQTVNEKGCTTCGAGAGGVTWSGAVLAFKHEDDFAIFAKAVDKLVDDDGVDFGLASAAIELQTKAAALRDEIAAAKKSAKAREGAAQA